MADKIVASYANTYSNNNGFKEKDGVYVWNFTKSVINQFAKTAEKKNNLKFPMFYRFVSKLRYRAGKTLK